MIDSPARPFLTPSSFGHDSDPARWRAFAASQWSSTSELVSCRNLLSNCLTRVIKEDFMSVGSGYGSDGGAALVAPMTAYARPWRVAVIAGLASFVDGT